MEHAEAVIKKFSVHLSEEENQRYMDFLKRRGSKKGPFARVLILEAVERDEAVRAGRTQIDPAAMVGGGQA